MRKIIGSVVGVIIFIVINNLSSIISGEVLTNRGIIFILKDIVFWIVFFIILLNLIAKRSEKNADKLAR